MVPNACVGVCVRVGDADIRCRVDTFEYYDTISREDRKSVV